ncbi:MAG: hypothetical protein DRP63_01425 [Planctomycetota bacterium]|nr:MAG: hypothetical protein DRP63_01425 [Planctomycetota bacterium]
MSSFVLVNAREGTEIRVAVVRNDTLVDFFYERVLGYRSRVGDIYKARITSVDRSLDALFVDIGADRHGFLPRAHIRTLQNSKQPLTKLFRTGQTLNVQVVREESAQKGALLTTYVSIPGRYLVLCPFEDGVRISRKIMSERVRQRLIDVVGGMVPEAYGFVIRTAAQEARKADLARDLQFIIRLYNRLKEKSKRVCAPSLLYSESDLAIRVIRDFLPSGNSRIVVDEPATYERMKAFLEEISPRLSKRLQLYRKTTPLFDEFGIESAVELLMGRRIDLPSGGWLTIDITEGMVCVDVNTGSAKGETTEQTALQTNLEAVVELARQLHLRDLGGLIVVDLVDMKQRANRKKVESRLRKALRQQKERFTMLPINSLGVLVMSRQKRREGALVPWSEKCRFCDGLGHSVSPVSHAAAALRHLQRYLAHSQPRGVRLLLHPAVAEALFNHMRKTLASIEKQSAITVEVSLDASLKPGTVQIVPL